MLPTARRFGGRLWRKDCSVGLRIFYPRILFTPITLTPRRYSNFPRLPTSQEAKLINMALSTQLAASRSQNPGWMRMQQAVLGMPFLVFANQLTGVRLAIVNSFWHLSVLIYTLHSIVGTLYCWVIPRNLRFWFKNFVVVGLVVFIVVRLPLVIHQADINKAAISPPRTPKSDANQISAPNQTPGLTGLAKSAAFEEHCSACGPRAAAAPWNSGGLASTCDLYAVLGLDTPLPSTQLSAHWHYTQKQIHSAAVRQLDRLERDEQQFRVDHQRQSWDKHVTEGIVHSRETKLAAAVLRARRVLEDPSMRTAYDDEIMGWIFKNGAIGDICACGAQHHV